MTDVAIPSVDVLRVLAVQDPHPFRDREGGHLDQQVHMIRHQAVREHTPFELLRDLLEQPKIVLAVVIVGEDRMLAVAATPDVPYALRLISRLSGHTATLDVKEPRQCRGSLTSGCRDLNSGPLRPERRALPGCATPRTAAQGTGRQIRRWTIAVHSSSTKSMHAPSAIRRASGDRTPSWSHSAPAPIAAASCAMPAQNSGRRKTSTTSIGSSSSDRLPTHGTPSTSRPACGFTGSTR